MKNNKQKGYAILFTVIIISIILTIAIGLSSSSYKQLVLSSVAKDSQLAFYSSDTATECVLYADAISNTFTQPAPASYSCGVDKNGSNYTLSVSSTVTPTYEQYDVVPTGAWATSLDPCFALSVNKTIATDPIVTTIAAKGYNLCLKTSPRTVEREIDISY